MELPSSMLPLKKKNPNKSVKNLESHVFQNLKAGLKRSKRTLRLTRVETWVSPGVPDLLVCDEQGLFHFIELKTTTSNAVRLSAHQVAWLTLHSNASSWILVGQPHVLHLYHAKDAINLQKHGLKEKSVQSFNKPFSWQIVFNLISPI